MRPMPDREIWVLFRGLPSEAETRGTELRVVLSEGSTVSALLEKLASASTGKARLVLDPVRKSLRPEFLMTLNGRFLEKSRFASTVLKDGDTVEVFPVPSGG